MFSQDTAKKNTKNTILQQTHIYFSCYDVYFKCLSYPPNWSNISYDVTGEQNFNENNP